MNKIVCLLTLLSVLAAQSYATAPAKIGKPKVPAFTLEQQLEKYVSYPDVLGEGQRSAVVVIQFRVDAEDKLCQLKVFSQNDAINQTLIRQLTGRKLSGYGRDATQLHTVRLRFRPE